MVMVVVVVAVVVMAAPTPASGHSYPRHSLFPPPQAVAHGGSLGCCGGVGGGCHRCRAVTSLLVDNKVS